MYRQGDVLIVSTTTIPASATPVPLEGGRIVLAHGEVTGHAHAIASPDAELLATPGATAETADRWLRVRSAVTLAHEEHTPITIPPGEYRVIRQREYDPELARQVAD